MDKKKEPTLQDMLDDKELADQVLRNFMASDPPEDSDSLNPGTSSDMAEQIEDIGLEDDSTRDNMSGDNQMELVVLGPGKQKRPRSTSSQPHRSGEVGIKTPDEVIGRCKSAGPPVAGGYIPGERPPDKYMRSSRNPGAIHTPTAPCVGTQTAPVYAAKHYTPSHAVIDYLDNPIGIPPIEMGAELRDWYADNWDGLIQPPEDLRIEHFIKGLPDDFTNSAIQRRICIADNNLYTARIKSHAHYTSGLLFGYTLRR